MRLQVLHIDEKVCIPRDESPERPTLLVWFGQGQIPSRAFIDDVQAPDIKEHQSGLDRMF